MRTVIIVCKACGKEIERGATPIMMRTVREPDGIMVHKVVPVEKEETVTRKKLCIDCFKALKDDGVGER